MPLYGQKMFRWGSSRGNKRLMFGMKICEAQIQRALHKCDKDCKGRGNDKRRYMNVRRLAIKCQTYKFFFIRLNKLLRPLNLNEAQWIKFIFCRGNYDVIRMRWPHWLRKCTSLGCGRRIQGARPRHSTEWGESSLWTIMSRPSEQSHMCTSSTPPVYVVNQQHVLEQACIYLLCP